MPASRDDLEGRSVGAIVIGGSTGGIEAIRGVLSGFARPLPAPVLVVLHFAPGTKGAASVFEGTGIAVREAEDKDVAEAGTIHVAPPDYHLLVSDSGTLSLSVEEPVNHSRPSIDVLFESASWSYGQRLLGIVVSGANADGAAGLAAIRRAGGLCWVQAPETAVAAAMPRAALQSVPDARVLSPLHMAEVLGAWSGPSQHAR